MTERQAGVGYRAMRFIRPTSVAGSAVSLPVAPVFLQNRLPDEVAFGGLVHLPVVEFVEELLDDAIEVHRVLDFARSGVVAPEFIPEDAIEVVDGRIVFRHPDSDRFAVRSHTESCKAVSLNPTEPHHDRLSTLRRRRTGPRGTCRPRQRRARRPRRRARAGGVMPSVDLTQRPLIPAGRHRSRKTAGDGFQASPAVPKTDRRLRMFRLDSEADKRTASGRLQAASRSCKESGFSPARIRRNRPTGRGSPTCSRHRLGSLSHAGGCRSGRSRALSPGHRGGSCRLQARQYSPGCKDSETVASAETGCVAA